MRALWLLAAVMARAAEPVWIDTDPSMSRGGHEEDDGFALIQAFRSPEIVVRGVSVVFGNAPLEKGFPIGEEFVRRFGPPGLKVYSGAASAADLGNETDATRALADALRRERLTVLVLGPATNVATVLELHPELRRRIKQLIAVAGRRPGQRFTAGNGKRAFRDFNFELNPQAFHVLLKSGVPLVLAPWEISSKVWLTKDDIDRLRPDNPPIEWLYEPVMDWLEVWKRDLGVDGFNPFDTLAVGYLTARAGFQCRTLPTEIRRASDDTGPGPDKPYLLVAKNIRSPFRVEYCSDAGPGFKDHLLARLIP